MTEELSRTSALAARHITLGSGLEDWNGMGTAWSYATNPEDEHNAIRDHAGMFDMSPLKKVIVSGENAMETLNYTVTRDLSRLSTGQSVYTSVLTEKGTMADDAIVSNNGNDEWMIVHGSGDTMDLLYRSAEGKNVEIFLNDGLHNISVQGPKALEILNNACSFDLSELAYFHHSQAQVFGHPCRISRTGYSGEKGYEVFVDQSVVGDIWDNLVKQKVMPCSFAALDKVRIEAGLLFYGYDMTNEQTPWEVGLGFTVSNDKAHFRGKKALEQVKGDEKLKLVCLEINHPESLVGGETLKLNGEEVGVINSPCYSHRLRKSLALAHINPKVAHSSILNLLVEERETTATIVELPIYDPEKLRPHS